MSYNTGTKVLEFVTEVRTAFNQITNDVVAHAQLNGDKPLMVKCFTIMQDQ